MPNAAERHRINARRHVQRKTAEGYRAVNVLLPPDLVEALERIAPGQPRARTVVQLIERANQELETTGGGA